MTFAKRLRALKRALAKAAFRLRIEWIGWRQRVRARAALTKIQCGESVRDLGERIGDRGMIADGCALIDAGAQELNEIETGYPAEPRPASWWRHHV